MEIASPFPEGGGLEATVLYFSTVSKLGTTSVTEVRGDALLYSIPDERFMASHRSNATQLVEEVDEKRQLVLLHSRGRRGRSAAIVVYSRAARA